MVLLTRRRAPANPSPEGRLTLPAILAFSATGLPLGGIVIGFAIFLQPYLASHLQIPLMVIAGAWFTVRMLDFGIDVVLGLLMDRFVTRWGRYRLWFVAGLPLLMLGIYKLFMAPPGIGGGYLVTWLFVYYLGNSMVTLAHLAWSATLITQYHERSRVFGLMTPISILGSLMVLAIPTISERLGQSNAQAVQMIGWFAILALPVAVAIVVFFTPEPIAPEIRRKQAVPWADYWSLVKNPSFLRLLIGEAALVLGPGWMSALYVFFFTHALGSSVGQGSLLLGVYVISGALGAPAAAALAMRISKHRTLFLAAMAYSVGLCTVLLVPNGKFLLAMPTMVWCGFMAAAFTMMTRAMTADFGDEIRLEQGRERITLIYAFTSLMAKLASAMAGVITYSVLAAVGFNPAEGAINTPEAIRGLELAFTIGPIFFVMIGGASFLGWKLDSERHAGIRADLEARDARNAEAPVIESLTGDHT